MPGDQPSAIGKWVRASGGNRFLQAASGESDQGLNNVYVLGPEGVIRLIGP